MIAILLYIVSIVNVYSTPAEEVVNSQEAVVWYTWEEAYAMNKDNPKKIFVDLYTSWCGWCKKMDKTTFQDPQIVKYLNENFYPIKFNAEQREDVVFQNNTFKFVNSGRRGVHQLAYALLDGRLGYPSFVLLDESFARIMVSPGFKIPEQLIKELTYANEEKYKEMSWEDYSSTD